MKVIVDYDACEANAVCMGIAPEVFEVRDDDNLYILIEGDIPQELQERVRQAVASCPKAALSTQD
ncbi:MAG: ferredoxin [Frankiales bacterium]|jgi:ferredoxin|nr:ferredoxin [Frankiales bacterium]